MEQYYRTLFPVLALWNSFCLLFQQILQFLLILCFDWFCSLGAFKICFAKIAIKEKFHCLIKASVYFLPKEKVNYVELMFR